MNSYGSNILRAIALAALPTDGLRFPPKKSEGGGGSENIGNGNVFSYSIITCQRLHFFVYIIIIVNDPVSIFCDPNAIIHKNKSVKISPNSLLQLTNHLMKNFLVPRKFVVLKDSALARTKQQLLVVCYF